VCASFSAISFSGLPAPALWYIVITPPFFEQWRMVSSVTRSFPDGPGVFDSFGFSVTVRSLGAVRPFPVMTVFSGATGLSDLFVAEPVSYAVFRPER
jgi:hypothetical protein